MFNPSREDVRRFFCEAWRKRRAGEVVTPLEGQALKWVDRHPEYQALLGDPEAAIGADFAIDRSQSNPFLHLSMHLCRLCHRPRPEQPLPAPVHAPGDRRAARH